VPSANGHSEFPIQNLPFGIFSPADGAPRGGVAIGDMIFDLKAAFAAGSFSGDAAIAADAAAGRVLNQLMGLDAGPRRALRRRLSALLAAGAPERPRREELPRLLYDLSACRMELPAAIGNFTDFFAGIHYARNGGMRRDPSNPLNPNQKFVPVAYHSRASWICPSRIPVRRPTGQRKASDDARPSFSPSQTLDYELELSVWIGPGNAQGEPIPIARAADHIFGLGLVNDWSARDV
jgi:fumarylacetoacetase